MPRPEKKQSGRRRSKEWWWIHEQIAAVFETLFQPLELKVLHDTRQRDVVGELRQLDVGVIDTSAGEQRVHALVEVQKRKAKVGLNDLGGWIYKRNTLQAQELVAVSEKGFSAPVLQHVKKLHPDNVRLGTLHETETGFIERINSTCLGMARIYDLFWFASIFVQFADADEIKNIQLQGLDTESNVFGSASPMDLIREMEAQHGSIPAGTMHACTVNVSEETPLSYEGRPIKRILITSEKQRRIWEPVTHFYAYDEVHPNRGQRGIAIVSTFRVDESKTGKLTLVISPDPQKTTGNYARIAGQFEFIEMGSAKPKRPGLVRAATVGGCIGNINRSCSPAISPLKPTAELARKRRLGLGLLPIERASPLPCPADPAPFLHHGPAAKERRLKIERIETRHVFLRVAFGEIDHKFSLTIR